ncbi:uncharacterized protein EKO05_0003603 [Ascochyta rabiei]|uniref:uncharacterized protein n=1 Tax=Didymella rabiei TaxID=5454 RepID=UPI00220FC837|nr:uncharacterized protein EKO05_0003603 [Ascochyta rabiei]UPX13075.1 hypothetical protein EKO05_0003603 [Ascochyta rabiei]
MEATMAPQISGVSLGMLIMDEIRMPNKAPLHNVIGGSSTFVTLGLRLFASDPSSVGCLILAGSDFPPSVEDEVRAWDTTLVLQKDATKRSSRGLLVYEDDTFGPKTFEYTTPPIRAAPGHLIDTPLLGARAFHMFGRPEEVLVQVPELLRLRHSHDPSLPRPLIVWEPLPSSCHPSALPTFLSAMPLVDVFSPNHLELAALFHPDSATTTLQHLANLGAAFLDARIGPDGNGTLVVRAGADVSRRLSLRTSKSTSRLSTLRDPKKSSIPRARAMRFSAVTWPGGCVRAVLPLTPMTMILTRMPTTPTHTTMLTLMRVLRKR